MIRQYPSLGYRALHRLLRGGGFADCWKGVILWRNLVNPANPVPPLDILRLGFWRYLGCQWSDEVHEEGWLW